MPVTLTYTLAANTPENVNQVQQNFSDIRTWSANISGGDLSSSAGIVDTQLASPNNAAYKTILEGRGAFAPAAPADTWVILTGGFDKSGSANFAEAPTALELASADYAVGSKTTKLRLRAQVFTNNTAPGVTFTAGLYPISAVLGGASVIGYTLGTVVSGSTVAFTTPAHLTATGSNSGDFTFPADDIYAFGVVTSGSTAASSVTGLNIQLQIRHV